MKNVVRKACVLMLFAFAFAVVPAQAQSKGKALKNVVKSVHPKPSPAKNTIKKAINVSKEDAIRGARVATQHITTESCSSCSGKGYFYYSGDRYDCQACRGTGKKIKVK